MLLRFYPIVSTHMLHSFRLKELKRVSVVNHGSTGNRGRAYLPLPAVAVVAEAVCYLAVPEGAVVKVSEAIGRVVVVAVEVVEAVEAVVFLVAMSLERQEGVEESSAV